MKVRNITKEAIEFTESGVFYRLEPGQEVPVLSENAFATIESNFGKDTVARVYEDGEYRPSTAPDGALIVGINYDLKSTPEDPEEQQARNLNNAEATGVKAAPVTGVQAVPTAVQETDVNVENGRVTGEKGKRRHKADKE